MSPPRRFPTSIEQLFVLLAASRRSNEPFKDAWERVVKPDGPLVLTSTRHAPAGVLLWPSDYPTRSIDREAILATRDTWRRAYDRIEPTTQERALVALLPALDGVVAGIEQRRERAELSQVA